MSAPSPVGDVRFRLQAALRAAMKERDMVAVSALRSALAAIANAEAVPLPAAPSGPPAVPITGPGSAEVSRRAVTDGEATAIAAAEAAERRAAARDYRAAGHPDRAGRLLREARAIESALYMAAGPDGCLGPWSSNTSWSSGRVISPPSR